MKKEYIKPEAEMMKFVETEEIMTGNQIEDFITSTLKPEGWYD